MTQLDSEIGPNFFLIGAAKGGTTFLSGLLDQHDEIFICKPKEPAFFAWHWQKGWSWYATCFDGADRFRFRGDASTFYSAIETYPKCLPRIKEFCPDAKIIYVVRDPLPRLATLWKTMVRASWRNTPPFEEAVRSESLYIDSSQYWKQFTAYRDQFGAENIKLFFFEDYVRDPIKIAVECVDFLGASTSFNFDLKKSYKNPASKMRRARPLLIFTKQHMRFLNNLYAALPKPVQGLVRLVFKEKINTPTYSPAFRAWVLGQVRNDALKILNHFGKPSDFWDLE